MGSRGCIVMVCGAPGTGKTTMVKAMEEEMKRRGEREEEEERGDER